MSPRDDDDAPEPAATEEEGEAAGDESEADEDVAEETEGAVDPDAEEVDDELARHGEHDLADADVPASVVAGADAEIKPFLEALMEKGVLVLVEGATVDEVVPSVIKALARKDRRRASSFLDALIDDDNVDEVFLDEEQVVKLLAAWF